MLRKSAGRASGLIDDNDVNDDDTATAATTASTVSTVDTNLAHKHING